ncbi:GNAT family N-acetyltransferase [Catellatospora tritici]|uniref:GNAT family N-acetyltransferase n=1 Tax=Catellatospora tritici TaxID=2851566 RepID=UPI001C2CD4B5|nr:GNAT family N-acetyltransferase [Catellatospora tritici]MBV1848572.1 GNAT family N-acetyltransferase [Catellatospora tritici]
MGSEARDSVITVRAETVTDCAAVAALHIESWRAAYVGIVPDHVLAALDVEQRTRERVERLSVSDSPFTNLIAVDTEPVGWVCFGPYREEGHSLGGSLDAQVGEILALYVRSDRWGTGVADRLIEAALAGLPQPEVRLWALTENTRALRFYARHGLRPDGTHSTFRPRGSDVDIPELRCTLIRELGQLG